MIRTAFLGTPGLAIPTLDVLARLTDLRVVVTMPDRRRGRGKSLAMPEVKHRALDLGIPVSQPTGPQELDDLFRSADVDVGVVVAFGMLVDARTLARPSAGMLNLHFSLLPRWRGAAPVERAILAGDSITGVTLMQMDAGLDTGGCLAAWQTSIDSDETGGRLTRRLARAAAELCGQQLENVVSGTILPEPQDDDLATYAKKVTGAEARLDFGRPARELARAIRAFNPRPGAYTIWRGRRFKIHLGRVAPGSHQPGRLLSGKNSVRVGTAVGCLELLEVQPEGSNPMEATAWVRGVKGEPGRFD